jgi:hypothetical protein
MTDPGSLRERQNRIDRYRAMEREVTDPLAARLLHDIVLDLEADAGPWRGVRRYRSSSGCTQM